MPDVLPSPNYELWCYTPSFDGNIILAVIYCILLGGHLVILLRDVANFGIPLLIGGILEIIGYGCRIYSHYNLDNIVVYTIQLVLILVAPLLMAPTLYMFLGRLISKVYGEGLAIRPQNWLFTGFFICNIICFLIQCIGAGLLPQESLSNQVQRYSYIVFAGLLFQSVIYLLVVILALLLHFRMRKSVNTLGSRTHWQAYLISFYVITILLLVRTLLRVIEFAAQPSEYINTQEWILFVFDAGCILSVLALSFIWYNLKPRLEPVYIEDLEYPRRNIFQLK
ncbi:RTA1 like protein-domain-containing protein [Lipomyces oligophaga]|uniref:RTA1 like protein-domain-containing protein n=1 Tax=Lipomyces oligophaga TaxID=45792 RepID=UPI0034CD1F04